MKNGKLVEWQYVPLLVLSCCDFPEVNETVLQLTDPVLYV